MNEDVHRSESDIVVVFDFLCDKKVVKVYDRSSAGRRVGPAGARESPKESLEMSDEIRIKAEKIRILVEERQKSSNEILAWQDFRQIRANFTTIS